MKALASNLHLLMPSFPRLLVALILMVVLATSFVQLPTPYSAELTAPEKTLTPKNGTASSMSMYVITATAIIALVAAALLVYFRKIEKQ